MKRLLLLAMITATLASCKKDKTGCYNCSFGTSNGVQHEDIEWCGDPHHNFTDAQGNPLSSYCRPK